MRLVRHFIYDLLAYFANILELKHAGDARIMITEPLIQVPLGTLNDRVYLP
jgi:hypothetical protein